MMMKGRLLIRIVRDLMAKHRFRVTWEIVVNNKKDLNNIVTMLKMMICIYQSHKNC